MFDPILLSVWGGVFYLLQKILLSVAERIEWRNPLDAKKWRVKRWRVYSWAVYLIGLPPWVILFIQKDNWIAAAIEAGGAPSMLLGLVFAFRGIEKEAPKWLDIVMYVTLGFGLGYSVREFHGITTFSQILELGIGAGFFIGTYRIALKKLSGYGWYVLMCGSTAYLMGMEHLPWLLAQQIISLFFIFDAYYVKRKRLESEAETL